MWEGGTKNGEDPGRGNGRCGGHGQTTAGHVWGVQSDQTAEYDTRCGARLGWKSNRDQILKVSFNHVRDILEECDSEKPPWPVCGEWIEGLEAQNQLRGIISWNPEDR